MTIKMLFFFIKKEIKFISDASIFYIANLNNLLSNQKNFFQQLVIVLFWLKIRVLYYTNNWIYTTNHKRIAVNYFWFVILSGIVGMVLATLIRLEFAYPGVGIFAGDSLQYLSLVTAHGVIMVFFMIMPLLLGAFANFLLPTQLGVHDVAFPRLNSAAFWFLPGGLLMLAQLVCVDRRYQRMNCFNIREIQSILKRRFFVDLINAHDHRKMIHKTMVDLKYKINDNYDNPNFFNFYNYGIETSPKTRFTLFSSLRYKNETYLSRNSLFYDVIENYKSSSFFYILNKIYFQLFNIFYGPFFLISNFKKILNKSVSAFDSIFSLSQNGSWRSVLTPEAHFENLNNNFLQFSMYLWILFLKLKLFILNFVFNIYYFFWKLKQHSLMYHADRVFTDLLIFFKVIYDFLLNFLILNIMDFFFIFNILEIFYFSNSFIFKNFNIFFFTNLSFFFYLSEFIRTLVSTQFLNKFFVHFPMYSYFYKSIHLNFYKYYFSPNTSAAIAKSSKNDFFSFIQNPFEIENATHFYSYRNFNSHIIYIYIFCHFITQIPYFFLLFIYNIFNFKEMSVLINNFGNLLTVWYIPLLINDNIFYVFWQKVKLESFFNVSFFGNSNSTNNEFVYFNFSKGTVFNLNISKIWEISFFLVYEFFFVFFFFVKNLFQFLSILFFNFKTYFFFNFIYNFYYEKSLIIQKKEISSTPLFFFSKPFTHAPISELNILQNEELSTNARYHRFDNPLFKYDYKSGDYYPKLYKEVYPFLLTSVIELTGGLRQSPWFFSELYEELSSENFNLFLNNYLNLNNQKWFLAKFTSLNGFYNFFFSLNSENFFLNKRWISVSSMDQKFYKFFHTSSMQQRIYANWRQLKFTRESWRCKLLMSRHQKTLFKRYVNEDGVFWSIERNAKDLLPGWAMITPFSSRTRFTAIGKTDIGLMGVLLVLNSSIISAANFIVTYRYLSTLNNRKMRDARSFFTEAIMVSSWMMIAANPMLVIGIIMLLSDRHWQTSFFDYSGGGDTVLFQHMFWFFGHPEVYIIILPTFGFVNTMLSYYLKKRVSARASLLYSMYTIAFLGFFVWGHHMYMVGLAHTTRMLFSTLTVMISVPAATKLMHWCVTTVNSSFAMELPLVYTLTFIFLFVSGGISGMCVAHTGMDVLFHDTFYVIGHFHVMLAGAAMIASFGAFYFYFVAIFGVKYSRIYAYLHFTYYLLGQLFTVIPMFWLGYAGMPRRVLDYPASFGGWHSVISGGHMLSVAGLIAFFIMIFDSLRQAKATTRNTFGIGRYNTRLNFYIYEIAKLNNVQEKAWSFFKFLHIYSLKLNNLNFYNFEHYETTLFSYTFSQKHLRK